MAGEALRVFISYARRDGEAFAEDLVSGLELAGFEAFLDRHDIAVGEDWEARLGGLIHSADTVVFAITPGAIASDRCAWEVQRAEGLSKRIIPVVAINVADADIPLSLRKLQYIPFTKELSFAKALASLAKALKVDLGWIREHTRIQDMAQRWEDRGRPQALLLRGSELETTQAWLASWKTGAPPPTDIQRDFINESDAQESAAARAQRRRQRNVVVMLSLALVAFAGLGVAAAAMWRQADVSLQAARLAEETTTYALSAQKLATEAQKRAATDADMAKVDAQAAREEAEKNATVATRQAAAARQAESAAQDAVSAAFQMAVDKGRQALAAGDYARALDGYLSALFMVESGRMVDRDSRVPSVEREVGLTYYHIAMGGEVSEQQCAPEAAGGNEAFFALRAARSYQEAALERLPNHHGLRTELGCSYLALNDTSSALAMFRGVAQQQPSMEASLNVAVAQMKGKDWTGARAMLLNAPNAQNAAPVLLLLATTETAGRASAVELASVSDDEAQRALRHLDRLLTLEPANASALLFRGSLLARKPTDLARARRDFEKATFDKATTVKGEANYRLSLIAADLARKDGKDSSLGAAAVRQAEAAVEVEPSSRLYRTNACGLAEEFAGRGASGLVSCADKDEGGSVAEAYLRTGVYWLKRAGEGRVSGDQRRAMANALNAFDRGSKAVTAEDKSFDDLPLTELLDYGVLFVRYCAGLGPGDTAPTAPAVRAFFEKQGLSKCPVLT